MDSPLSPRRPYLLRAFYEWLLDNELTPHLAVDVTFPGVSVPMEYASGGQIVLNIAPRATQRLEISNDEVRFSARFGGVPRQVIIPMAAVQAVYARENGAGISFEPEAEYMKAYKKVTSASRPETLHAVVDNTSEQPDDPDDDTDPPPRKGRPKLRVVK